MAMDYKEYLDCVNAGGKQVTKKLKNGRFINICYDKTGVPHATFFKRRKNDVKDISKKNDIIINEQNKKKFNKPTNKQPVKKFNAAAPTQKSIEDLVNYFSKSTLT